MDSSAWPLQRLLAVQRLFFACVLFLSSVLKGWGSDISDRWLSLNCPDNEGRAEAGSVHAPGRPLPSALRWVRHSTSGNGSPLLGGWPCCQVSTPQHLSRGLIKGPAAPGSWTRINLELTTRMKMRTQSTADASCNDSFFFLCWVPVCFGPCVSVCFCK